MAKLLRLEEFSAVNDGPVSSGDMDVETRLNAYEDGYKAGWDDAVSANSDEQSRISSDLAKSLQEISFGYHEARTHVLENVADILKLMSEKLLPEAAREHFSQTVIERAKELAEGAADAPIEVLVNPQDRAAIETVIGESPPFPISLKEESSLTTGQAFFKSASGEHSLDLTEIETSLRSAVDGFLTTQNEVQNYG